MKAEIVLFINYSDINAVLHLFSQLLRDVFLVKRALNSNIFPNAKRKDRLRGLVHGSVGIGEGGWKE